MQLEIIQKFSERTLATLVEWATSPQFYAQAGAIVAAVALAHIVARLIRTRVPVFEARPEAPPASAEVQAGGLSLLAVRAREILFASRDMLFPLFAVLSLAAGVELTMATVGTSWLVRIAQSVAVINVLYTAISRYVTHPLLRAAGLYVLIPIAALKVFGWFDEAVTWLDSLSLQAGNIRLSVLALIKAAIFGGILFWLGRISNEAGQKAIRKQEALDIPTRELFAKLFQIAVFCAAFILLLQVLGLDLTALAIFGGALGVGIGFGLQKIAANFISGIIILLERSLKVGDYIEMDGGKAGILTELNMRSTTLETFDGKEILVPNETLITTSFANWTKTDNRHEHEVGFLATSEADVREVKTLIEKVAASHPRVLGAPEAPVCELRGFGDKTLTFALQFWVDGIEGGPHKVPSEMRLLIWEALKEHKLLPRS